MSNDEAVRAEIEAATTAAFAQITAALDEAIGTQAESWLTAEPEDLIQDLLRAASRAMWERGPGGEGSVTKELTDAVAAGIGALLLCDDRVLAVRARVVPE